MTLRDHFARVLGGGADGRFGRLCSIIVDGTPLGDHRTNVQRNREEAKRFVELQWAAIALVGCDADLQIREIRSLAPRHGAATPDLEAALRDDRTVRLELSRIVFGSENQQNAYFATIAGVAQQTLEKVPAYANAGTFHYRVYDPNGTKIGKREALAGAAELAAFIQGEARLQKCSASMYAPDAGQYPTLSRLGVHVCHDEPVGTAVSVMWDPMTEPADVPGALDVFNRIRTEKAAKVSEYSDGGTVPVWLVFAAQSLKQKFLALSLVNHLAGVNMVDPAPFERVLVGCYAAGVTFLEPGKPPRYTSLTTTG